MAEEICLIHGLVMTYDMRSGFYLCSKCERKINVELVLPPIPIRNFDFQATFEGYEPGDPIGYGETREAAIADLMVAEGE